MSVRILINGVDDEQACRAAADRAREAAVLELYRRGQLGSGRAARDLGISRLEFLDLANGHGVATIQTTTDELQEEVASLEP